MPHPWLDPINISLEVHGVVLESEIDDDDTLDTDDGGGPLDDIPVGAKFANVHFVGGGLGQIRGRLILWSLDGAPIRLTEPQPVPNRPWD